MFWDNIKSGQIIKHLYLANGAVNDELYKKGIIIYGCGNDGRKLYSKLKSKGECVKFFCDSNKKLHGKTIFDIPVISYENLSDYRDCNIALAFHKWSEVIDKIPESLMDSVFADFLYEHPTNETCILCGSTNCTYDKAHFAPFIQERMFKGEKRDTQLIHCLRCGLYFSKYRPTQYEMECEYSNYRDENYQKQRQKFEPDYTKAYNEHFVFDKEYIYNRKKSVGDFLKCFIDFDLIENLLDYGGDEGQYIPDAFKKSNRYVYDISGNSVVNGVRLLNNLQDVKKIKWDFIMCCHLLEHVSDPVSVVNNLVDNLSEGSYLYIEVPNEDFICRYSDVEFNEHINFWNQITLNIIADIYCDLEIVCIQKRIYGISALYKKK